MDNRRMSSALWALVAVYIIWGLNLAFAKLALQDLPPFTFNVLRTGLSLLILVPLGLRSGLAGALREHWRQFIVIGIIGVTTPQVTFVVALLMAPGSIIAVLSSLGPLVLAVMSIMFLRERIAPAGWIGFAVATAGAFLVLGFSPSEFRADSTQTILGAIIFLSGSVAWAGFNVMSKRVVETYGPVALAAGTTIFGWASMVPLMGIELAAGAQPRFGGWAVFGIVYAGVLGTAIGFLILQRALRRSEGSRVGALSYIHPVVGVAASALLLGERPGLTFFAGSAFVLVGIALVTASRIRTLPHAARSTTPAQPPAGGPVSAAD
jgi:drug/metabolite transporter (DMT)-like permease